LYDIIFVKIHFLMQLAWWIFDYDCDKRCIMMIVIKVLVEGDGGVEKLRL